MKKDESNFQYILRKIWNIGVKLIWCHLCFESVWIESILSFAKLSQAPAPAPAGQAELALFSYNPTTPPHPPTPTPPPGKVYFGHSLHSI